MCFALLKPPFLIVFLWKFPVHRTKIHKIWEKIHLLRTLPCSVVFFHSDLYLDFSLKFVVYPKAFSLSHGSFPANRSSRGHLGVFLTVVFQMTCYHLSPNPQPGGSVRRIYIPQDRGAYTNPQTRSNNFESFPRHAWTTLDLFPWPKHRKNFIYYLT